MLARFMGRTPNLLTEKEAAEFLRVTTRHFRTMVRDGWLLPVYPEGPKGPAMYRGEEAAAFLAAKEDRMDLARAGHTASQAYALARSLHDRVESIYQLLGLNSAYVASDEDAVIATYLEAKTALEAGLAPANFVTLAEWTRRIRCVDDNFLLLLQQRTGDPNAWRTLLEYTRQLLLQELEAPRFGDVARWQQAKAVLAAARRELVYWVYLHVRRVDGVRRADKAIPVTWDDGVLAHLVPKN